MHRTRARLGALTAALIAVSGWVYSAAAIPNTPPDFVFENAFPGVAFNTPTAMAFLPDGRLLVTEKRGLVWVVAGGVRQAEPLWDGQDEVLSNGDRGLIAIAVDPDYPANRRVYFFYTVDPVANGEDDEVASFSRITRYETSLADSNILDPASRTVLIGETWSDGFASPTPFHAVGALRFGTDGSLLASHGDGAHYEFVDAGGRDPDQFLPGRTDPREDVGAFRSRDPFSLGGKVLRINPENGHGYAENPFAHGDPSSRGARVWSMGLRTPFRFCVRPGSGSPDTAAADPGTIYIGDVGHNAWEEINVARGAGLDFGWPCREGLDDHLGYMAANPARNGCATAAIPTEPTFAWSHTDVTRSIPFGIGGNCVAGGVFYTGSTYPDAYQGRLFFGDFAKGWVRVATLDDEDRIVQSRPFATELEGPVDWALDPVSGDLYYVSIYAGEVRRLRYTGEGGRLPPVAVASAHPPIAAAPAVIPFSSLGSYDPAGGDLTFAWNFGDGLAGSNEAHPLHGYPDAGVYDVILTVTATDGAIARDTMRVVLTAEAGFAVTPLIDSFDRADAPLAAPWAGSTSQFALQDGHLVLTGASAYTTWNGAVFGPNQEAFVTFDNVSASAPEQNLLLKVQSVSWSAGAIQVVHDASGSIVVVNTYTPGVGWARRGGPWRGVTFNNGDRFGARAYANGIVEVFRNDEVLGTASVADWPFGAAGGRIGIQMRAAPDARLDDFGGGDVSVSSNDRPRASIHEPIDDSFFVAGETVRLRGSGEDAEDSAGELTHLWNVTIRHNNHQHPEVLTFHAAVDSFVADNHDDGTGISMLVKYIVTDRGGLSDTAVVEIHPDIDLEPRTLSFAPGEPNGITPITVSFTLHNRGGMPSPTTRWRLQAGEVTIAESDTLVDAADSVRITRVAGPLTPASYTMTLTVDPDDELRESNEANNVAQVDYGARGFPASRVRDTFDRLDGALASPWTGATSGFSIRGRALAPGTGSANAIWGGDTLGPDQEAFVRFQEVTDDAPEHILLLKVQGPSRSTGAIQVVWSALQSVVVVNTYSPETGWARHGGPWHDVRFEPGDLFGARARANGSVTVYRNRVPIGTASVADWAFSGSGGRIGIAASGASVTRWVDFGGGDIGAQNSPPRAEIASPADDGHYVSNRKLVLRGAASDAEDDGEDLRFYWTIRSQDLDLTGSGETTLLRIPRSADDTGDSIRVALSVRDGGGLADTVEITLHPEIDLAVRGLSVEPVQGGSGAQVSFALVNQGRMASPPTKWMIVSEDRVLAKGVAAPGALDSVAIANTVRGSGAALVHLRAVADSLGRVVETDETNNARVQSWWPMPFPSTDFLDDFARADGMLGPPWIGYTTGFELRAQALALTAPSAYTLWDGAHFGPEQEAWIRFDSVDVAAPEHDLLLKVQGATWTDGAVQVVWSAAQSLVVVNTYDPIIGWQRHGGPWRDVHFEPGDVFGARALGDGTVYVFKNQDLIGAASLASWEAAERGGRVGLILNGAADSRIGEIGGGDVGTPRAAAQMATRMTPVVSLALHAARPNPTTGRVALALDLPRASRVAFEVYDLQGRRIWSDSVRGLESGRHSLRWSGVDRSGRNAGVGIYLARVTVDGVALTRRFAVVR